MDRNIEPQVCNSIYLESPVGMIRISGSDVAIHEVHFLKEAPDAAVTNNPGTAPDLIMECRNQLIGYFNGSRRVFDINISQPGTPFQNKVWNKLSGIRYGDTISYLTLAKQLGDQKVIRAAASANGRNNIAIIVPCHRVIGSSGDLVGFAGGLWRKKWLLDHELKFARGVQELF